jgi:hypothetical protein
MAGDLLQQAATQQQSPDAPVPLPTNPAGVILGAGAPPVQPQGETVSGQPTVQQPTQAQPTPDQQVQAHHSAIGQAITHFAHALEGKQVNYVTDPTTGDVTSVVQPRRPGGFFRDLLLGAIAGGAAASEKVPEGSGGLVGLTRGAQAGLQVGPQEQVRRYSAAMQKGKEVQQASARQLEQAAIADDTVSSLNLGHFVGVHSAQELNQYNSSVNTVKDQALNNGGQLAHLDGTVKNGEKGNGPAMMALVTAHPDIMVGPDGMHRAVFITHDLPDGTSHDGEKWTDADGQHPDWNANATVTLVDIPSAIWGKSLSLPNKTWNSAAGREIAKGDPDKTSQGTFGSLFSLGLRSKKDILAARTERERGPKDEDEATSWVAAAEDADKTSPDYAQIQSRSKKGQAFLDATAAEKEAEKKTKTPLVDSPEKARAALTDAQLALQNAQRANPKDPDIPVLQQAVKDAQQRYSDQSKSATDIAAKKKSDELQAQRVIENGDLGTAAKNVVDDNLAQMRDLASFKGDQKARLYNMIAAEAKAAGKDPRNYSPSALEAKSKVLNDFSDGKAADNIMAFNTFLGHANDALDATAAMRAQTGSPLINRPINWLRKNAADDTNFTAFQTALVPVRKEFMTFLNNNRAEHEDDLKTMGTVLSDTASPAQIEAALKQLGQSADIRLQQLGRKYSNTMKAAYPDLITPDGQAALARMGIKSELAAPAASPSGGKASNTPPHPQGAGSKYGPAAN